MARGQHFARREHPPFCVICGSNTARLYHGTAQPEQQNSGGPGGGLRLCAGYKEGLFYVFSRVAIVNRGEAAMRLIHAVRDLAGQTGTPIETVALHTDVDRTATFVREADLAHDLGPASARPYLDLAVLERALTDTGADAAWVGWGFVAEDPAFAELCARIGVTFIGPSAAAMRQLGDKIGAKLLAEEAGVPVAPWSRGAVPDLDAAVRAAAAI